MKDDNDILKKERELMLNTGIVFYPMILINNQTFRGDFEADEVKEAICAGFKNPPED